MKIKFWIVLYSHRHGINTYVVMAKRKPTEKQIIRTCEISDFEPDREENIEITEVTEFLTLKPGVIIHPNNLLPWLLANTVPRKGTK